MWCPEVKLEQEASFKLIGPRNTVPQKRFTRIDVRSLQRGDLAGRSAFYESMFDRGVFSPNDIRHAEGMNPIPDAEGGNKRFVMVNMQTLESAGTPDPSTGSGAGEPRDAPSAPDDDDPRAPEPGGGSQGGAPGASGPAD